MRVKKDGTMTYNITIRAEGGRKLLKSEIQTLQGEIDIAVLDILLRKHKSQGLYSPSIDMADSD